MRKILVYSQPKLHFLIRRLVALLLLLLFIGGFLLRAKYHNEFVAGQQYHQLLIVYGLAFIGIVSYLGFSYHHLAQDKFQVARINDQKTGLWLNLHGFRTRRIYVAFEWLTVQNNRTGIQLNYRRALALTRRDKMMLVGRGSITLDTRVFDKKVLVSFAHQLEATNQEEVAAGFSEIIERDIKTTKMPKMTLWKWFSVGATILFLGFIIWMGNAPTIKPSKEVRAKTELAKNGYHQLLDYQKPGQVVKARSLQLVINHLYHAISTDEKDLVIMNVTASNQGTNNELSLSGSNFNMYDDWSLRNEKEGETFDIGGRLNDNQVIIDGKEQPIINILQEGYEVTKNTAPRTFNIVLYKPNDPAFDIVYQGFYYDINSKPERGEDTSFVLHVKDSQLEELTNG